MSELADFLLARVAEREAVARAATPGPWVVQDMADVDFDSRNGKGWWWVWQESRLPNYGGVFEVDRYGNRIDPYGAIGEAKITDAEDGHSEHADAAHIALNDPAFVLAECEALRRVAEMFATPFIPHGGATTEHYVLRELALPYADHPDYHPDWAP